MEAYLLERHQELVVECFNRKHGGSTSEEALARLEEVERMMQRIGYRKESIQKIRLQIMEAIGVKV